MMCGDAASIAEGMRQDAMRAKYCRLAALLIERGKLPVGTARDVDLAYLAAIVRSVPPLPVGGV